MATNRSKLWPLVLAVFVLGMGSVAIAEDAPDVIWTRQFGTSNSDVCYDVVADAIGSSFVGGGTHGNLGGQNAGEEDAFLRNYDAAGNALWTSQLGSSSNDESLGVGVDGLGNSFLTGWTFGSLGATHAGEEDAFLSKYDSAGKVLWTAQLGTSGIDSSYGVGVDDLGNSYISGWTVGNLGGESNNGSEDAFLAKYNGTGTLQWVRLLGTSSKDDGTGVAVDGSGNSYVSGLTEGALEGANAGGWDAFLAKYDSAGNLLWTRQCGTPGADCAYDVAVDSSGNSYIVGETEGSLDGPNAGGCDVFLAKYNTDSTLQWIRQFGTSATDTGNDVAVDGSGNSYISGLTEGALEGENAGAYDAFLAKYDADGNQSWIIQWGTPSDDKGWGVTVDGLGKIYFSGSTDGSLFGTNAGDYDAFLVKVPEPATLCLLSIGLAGLGVLRRRRGR